MVTALTSLHDAIATAVSFEHGTGARRSNSIRDSRQDHYPPRNHYSVRRAQTSEFEKGNEENKPKICEYCSKYGHLYQTCFKLEQEIKNVRMQGQENKDETVLTLQPTATPPVVFTPIDFRSSPNNGRDNYSRNQENQKARVNSNCRGNRNRNWQDNRDRINTEDWDQVENRAHKQTNN